MNALQRRRFANSVYAFDVPAQRTLWFSVRGYGVIAAADLGAMEAFEHDTRRAPARWRAATA